MKKFSIIIPTYNQLPLLKRALESVLHQQDADYEVIVTDDSDNEGIAAHIQSIDNQSVKKLQQLIRELQPADNQPIEKLHQVGGEIQPPESDLIEGIDFPPLFALVPWRHHELQRDSSLGRRTPETDSAARRVI